MEWQDVIESYLNGNLTAAAEEAEARGAAFVATMYTMGEAEGWWHRDDAWAFADLLTRRARERAEA